MQAVFNRRFIESLKYVKTEQERILIRAVAKDPSDRKSDENKLLTDYFSAIKCLKELKINS